MVGLTVGMTTDAAEAVAVRSTRDGRRRRIGWVCATLLALLLAVAALLTSGGPWVADRIAPTAEQVSAGRDAVVRLRSAPLGDPGGARVSFARAELDGIGALASHGFRPGRLEVSPGVGLLTVTGSKPLPLGRWLNVRAEITEGAGFPVVRLRIGALRLSPGLSRAALGVAHWALRRRGAELPTLDRMVRNVEVGRDRVAATVFLPRAPEAIGRVVGRELEPIDAAAVAATYCRLAATQRRDPSDDFATQVRRAFARGGDPAANQAAFVALAMLVVDNEARALAGASRDRVGACRIDPVPTKLHGRDDLPKHWALSAALAAGTGAEFARAMGEWKELADSLPAGSGFSFIDLAADRAGYRAALAASDPERAAQAAAYLARATADMLLPEPLAQGVEGLREEEFRGGYGGLDDRRYDRMTARIERELDRRGAL